MSNITNNEKSKKLRTERKAEDYTTMDEKTHIFNISDTFIGSTEPEERDEIILDITNKKLINSKVSIAKGIERLFLEILSNAGDNADNSRRFGVNPGRIDVVMDREWITIRNGGVPIPVEQSPHRPDKLVPDLIFGELRSSSNYDQEVIRMGAGRNGFGAKLVNIFSNEFIVKIGDNKNKKLYTGVWKNHMDEGPNSVVEPYDVDEGFVEIKWKLDFERFGLRFYTDDAFFLFSRYVADFSLTCKVPVSFNGTELDLRNIRDYASLYWSPEDCAKALIHHEWPGHNKENENGICPLKTKDMSRREEMIVQAVKSEHIPIMEILLLDTPDEGVCLSYVNGLLTIDGGIHVKEVFNAIYSKITQFLETNDKRKKVKEEPGMKTPKITTEDVKKHVSIIINCRLPDPKYTSQSKTSVASPKPHVVIPEHIAKIMGNWNLIARLYAALEAKMFNVLKKSNGGKSKHINIDAGEDANEAGTENSHKCILYIVEGKSASSYPKKRIDFSITGDKNTHGKDYGGYYPLRGKIINVKKAPIVQVAENKEIQAIKKILGLVEGVDYSLPENLATLRYGYVMICVDADSDGFHIASLLINYINHYFNGLLKLGRVGILRTPVVRLFDGRGNIVQRFYNNSDFERWQKSDEGKAGKNLKIVYYKGLAKSDDIEIKDDLTTAPVVTVVHDEYADGSLTLAFDRSFADNRKEWISKWREVSHIEDIIFETKDSIFKQQNITDFINRELIDYTIDSLFRAIPSHDDGLKRSQRQALYSALKYFKFGRKNEFINVNRFSNFAANETNYHHGETSMCETVVKMTQTYIGSNNIPWFKPKGQFGSRDKLGDDAGSPRYINMCLPKYTSLLYDEEMIDCIPKRMVEGEEVEPMFVPAVIPMHLVNGVSGVATGYSTFIPNHNYYDIIDWCKRKCVSVKTGAPMDNTTVLKPWYRGFTGTIEFIDKKEDVKSEDEEINEESESTDDQDKENTEQFKKDIKSKGLNVKITGRFDLTQKDKHYINKIVINEIPIGISIESYRKWLNQLIKEKVISDYRNISTGDVPHIEITKYNVKEGGSVNFKSMKLEKTMSLNNLIMIDKNGYPSKFENTNEIMEIYSVRMFELYEDVKQRRLSDLRDKIDDLNHRIRFISAVIDGRIIIFKRPEKDIYIDMSKQSPPIPEKYLDLVKSSEYSKEKLDKKQEEITKLYDDFKRTEQIKPEDLWMERLDALEAYLRKVKFEEKFNEETIKNL